MIVVPPISFRLSEVHWLQGESASSPFVFVSERGSPFTTAGFARMIESAAAGASLKLKAHPRLRPAGPAARTEDVQAWRSGDQCGSDRGRPQHVSAGCQSPIPAVDNELLKARGPIRFELGGAGFDVEPAGPHAHLRSPVVVAGRFTTASARDRGSRRLFARVLRAPAQSSL
jgi:hypothetical protein